jgi:hypothetical protein
MSVHNMGQHILLDSLKLLLRIVCTTDVRIELVG